MTVSSMQKIKSLMINCLIRKPRNSFVNNLFYGNLYHVFAPPGRNFHTFLSTADFFKINFSGIPSECQTDLIQTRPNILLGLIWAQTVCKGYKQTTLGGAEDTALKSLTNLAPF